MVRATRSSLTLLLAVLLLLVACEAEPDVAEAPEAGDDEAEAPDAGDQPEGDPIPVGLIAPLTGPLASVGEVAKRGFDVGIAVVNDNGGVLGRPLEGVDAADNCDPGESLEVATELITREGVEVIVQGTCSSAALATADYINDQGVVNMLGLPTTRQLIDPSVHPYNFMTIVSSDAGGAAMAEQVLELGYERIALATENIAFGKDQIDAAADHLDEQGVEPVAYVEFPWDATDLTTYAQQLEEAEPDVILGCTQPPGFSALFDAMDRLDVQVPLLGCLGLTTPENIELAEDQIPNGTMAAVMNRPFWLDEPNINTFRETYLDMHGEMPRNPSDVHMYDAVLVWAEAAERAGTTDPDEVMAALASGEEFDNTGSKPVSYTQDRRTMWTLDEHFVIYLVETDQAVGSGSVGDRSFLDAGTLEDIGVEIPRPFED